MSVRSSLRAHPFAIASALLVILVVVVVALAVFFIARDERRAGQILSAILSERLRHPVQIARVATDGISYLALAGIRVPPAGAWSTDLTVREIRFEGPLLRLLVRPGGQHLRVRVVSTSVKLAEAAAPAAYPTGEALEQIRRLASRLLQWPATATFALSGGELRVQGQLTHFDLAGEKSADGRLALRLTARSDTGQSLTVEGVGSVASDALEVRLKAEGDPRALGGVWPTALVGIRHLSGAVMLRLPGQTLLELAGDAVLTPIAAGPPLSLTASAAYYPDDSRPDNSRLDLSHLSVRWGSSVALEGSGTVWRLSESPRLGLSLQGSVEGSQLRASLELDARDRTANSVVHVSQARLRRWLGRLGLADQLPQDLDAQVAAGQMETELSWAPDASLQSARLRARLDQAVVAWGQLQLSAPALQLVATVAPAGKDGLLAESSVSAQALDARLAGKIHRFSAKADTQLHLPRSAPWRGFGAPAWLGLTLSNPEGAPIFQARATSTGEGRIPQRQFTLQLSLLDLGRLPQLFPGLTYALTGSAGLDGRLGWSAAGALQFQGEARLQVPRAMFPQLGAELTDLVGSIPVWHNIEGIVPRGTMTMQSLTAYGVAFHHFSAPVQIHNGVLNLPETTYVHYGGTGAGWVQADLTDPSLPIRFRFEGSNVDLGRFFAESGLQAARITGQARYVVGLIHSRSFGVEVAGQFRVEPPGGVVSIDVLRRLLSGVPEDPLGVVRKTLEGLSEFRYKSLDGQIYMDQRETRLSLSLQGRERLGIFPPKIRAINIENLPLSRVVRILGPQMRRDR